MGLFFSYKIDFVKRIMGYVYCFRNDSMQGILKIGMTERTPIERLNEANTADTWRLLHLMLLYVQKR